MLTSQSVVAWLRRCGDVFRANQTLLTELDTAIGDADHGLNMRRGFDKVAEKLTAVENKDIGAILKATGMTLLSSVGGASGPLYGTFFLRAATEAAGKSELSLAELAAVIEMGVIGVIERGKAEPGDKTMCDVWWPMLTSLKAATDPANALDAMVGEGRAALAGTIPLVARKGRASYLGERSVGHQDPGATSSVLMVEALRDTLAETVS